MNTLAKAAAWLAAGWLVGCSGQSPTSSNGGAIATGVSASTPFAALRAPAAAALFTSTPHIGGALAGRLGAPMRAMSATLPRAAHQPTTVTVGAVTATIDMEPLGERRKPVDATDIGGMAVFADAAPEADRAVHAGADVVEELWLLHSKNAPHSFRIHVEASEPVVSYRVREARIELVDEAGKVRLSSAPMIAEDYRGVRRSLTVESTARTEHGFDVVVTLDGADLSYPVVVDPAWSVIPPLTGVANGVPAYQLASGKVLVLLPSLLFDPVTQTWSATVNSPTLTNDGIQSDPPTASAHLTDDTVLVVGNYAGGAEQFVPSTNTWSATANAPSAGFRGVAAFPSRSGKPAGAIAACGAGTTTNIYVGGFWYVGPALVVARTQCSMTTLSDGRVMIAGGGSAWAEIYDPATNAISLTNPTSEDRSWPILAKLPGGGALYAGSADATAEVYDPSTNTWSAAGSMSSPHRWTWPAIMPDGKVVVAGGQNPGVNLVDRFDPATKTWTVMPSMITGRKWAAISALSNGQILAAGGIATDSGSTTMRSLATAELYGEPLGLPCSSGLDCASGFCVDGVCCGTASCAAGAFCSTPTKSGTCAKPLGVTCGASTECESGLCVDGVCCGSACAGQCEACDVPGHLGACFPVTGQPHSARAKCGGPGAPCGLACDGTTTTKCSYAPTTVACGAASCTSGIQKSLSTCDGAGACKDTSSSCGAYACGTTSCLTSCSKPLDCAPGFSCKSNVCVAASGLGSSCSSAAECSSGFCTDGVCCGVALCDVGQSCALGATPGSCAKKLGVACTNNAECTAGTDGNGHCVDGVCCDTGCDGQCQACDVGGKFGTCSPVAGAAHGTRKQCDDGTSSLCAATACDGVDATKCAAFVHSSETKCGTTSCAGDVYSNAPTCDGAGTCSAPTVARCAPYKCDSAGCFTACSRNDQCDDGFACVAGACVAVIARCTPDLTGSIDKSGATTACAPYRCNSLGACATSCATSADCALAASCDTASKTCIASTTTSHSSGGCSTGTSNASGEWTAGALFALALVGMRRRVARRAH